MLRGWFCLCSGNRVGFCLLRSRRPRVACAPRWCMSWEIPRLSKRYEHHHFTVGTLMCFWCKFCFLLLSPFSLLLLLCWCAPRGGISRKVNLVSAVLVNAGFLRGRPVILWHQVHLSPHPYTAHFHYASEGTDRLNFKWQMGTDLTLAHLGFRGNIWKQKQLASKGSLGRGGKYQ